MSTKLYHPRSYGRPADPELADRLREVPVAPPQARNHVRAARRYAVRLVQTAQLLGDLLDALEAIDAAER